jgi:hypothetical protein
VFGPRSLTHILYLGYPNRTLVEQGIIFTSPRWKELIDLNGSVLQLSDIESHKSLGVGERYHAQFRRICHKIIFE